MGQRRLFPCCIADLHYQLLHQDLLVLTRLLLYTLLKTQGVARINCLLELRPL